MKLHLPKGLRRALIACLALGAAYQAHANDEPDNTRPNGLSGGCESGMFWVKGMYVGFEVDNEDLEPGAAVDSVHAERTEVVLTDAVENEGSEVMHGTMWNRFGGYLAASNISSEIGSSSLVIRDIADSVSISGWNVGGTAQVNYGSHLKLNNSYGVPTFNNVGTTSVSIEATKGSNFYVFGVDAVFLEDHRNTWQEFRNSHVNEYAGCISAGPISIIGGNLTNSWLTCAGMHSVQSVVSEGSHVNIGGGIITGHVVGGSAVLSLRYAIPSYEDLTRYIPPEAMEQFPSKEVYEKITGFMRAATSFDLWVEESHVTMTGGKMEKGWAHGQNGSQVSNYYYYNEEEGDFYRDKEGNPVRKEGITDSMVPRIIGGNLLHIADVMYTDAYNTSNSYGGDRFDPTEGWIKDVPGFGVGNTYVTISGNSEVYDVVGGSWSLIDIPDMANGFIDMKSVNEEFQDRYPSEEEADIVEAIGEIVERFDEKLSRDVHQGNTHVTLKDQVIVKGDVIAAGIQSGRTALITESTKISIGAHVKFEKDLTKYDSTQDKIVPVENMWEINGTHSIVDGGYMLTDPPMGDVAFDPYHPGSTLPWTHSIPVYSLNPGEDAESHAKSADAEYDMDAIEKKGYWNLGEFEKGGFGWNDADYSVYSDHPYVHGDRTLELGDAAEYDASLSDAYFINFDQVNVVKGGKATIGSLVIDDNQTFADDGTAPTSEKWSSKGYENDVPMEYRERNLTTISGGGEIRMWVGFDMEVWYWESKEFENSYKEYTEEELREMESGTTLNSDIGRKKYLSAVYDPEVLNNTYIAVKGCDDAELAKAERNEFGEMSKNTTLHLLPRQDENGEGNNAVSYAYRMDAYNGGVLHVDVAPKTGRNTMYVLNELNIHDEGYLKMTTNLTADMELQANAALHKAPKDTEGSAPGSVRELMKDWDTVQTVTFDKGYFDLRIKAADRTLYKDELYIVLIDRVTGNNVGTTTETRNYMITERTKEELRLWFGDDYDWEHDLTDLNEWDKHHVWIGVEKVTDGRETDGLSGEGLLEEDRKDHADDWAMVIRAKKVAEEEETHYHRRRHPHTPNGESGSDLMDEYFDHPTDDPDDDRKKVTERVVDLNSEERYEESDRLEAAVAGSSYSVLGLASADDVMRQLNSVRNRATRNLAQELVKVREAYENGGKGGLRVHEYPEAVPTKRQSFWVSAEGAYDEMKDRSTDPGMRYNAWGGSVGAAYALSNNSELGVALTAMYGDLESKGPDKLKGDMDTTYLSAYMRMESGRWTHSLIGTFGLVEMDGTRTVNIGGEYGGYETRYETDGYALGLMYELSYTVAGNAEKTSLYQAVANLAWRHVRLDGFTEQGDTAAKLRVGDQEVDSLVLGLGMRGQWLLSGDMFNSGSQLELRVLAKGYTGDLRNRVDVGFSDRTHHASVRSRKQGALGLEIGAGYVLPLGSGTGTYAHNLFLDVSAELRRACGDLNATLGYSLKF